MPAAPIIDLASLDLTQEVVTKSGLEEYLQQRGSFAMLDGVLVSDPEAGVVVAYKDIRADDWWAADHIPGRPMFPGALQIEAAAQAASFEYTAHRLNVGAGGSHGERFVGFGGVDNVRFRGVVTPECRFIVAVRLLKHSSRMFRYDAQGFVDQKMVFAGEVLGVTF